MAGTPPSSSAASSPVPRGEGSTAATTTAYPSRPPSAQEASPSLVESMDYYQSDELQKDYRYKKYAQMIDKILASFDAVNEWADVIGFLARLSKAFLTYPTYNIIPRKLLIAKRLAQCLNPALPSGVHQKALEVYGLIFDCLGTAQLAEDLPLWSYGLFPLLQSASMSVKPLLLNLYEKYYLVLGPRLRPASKGLLLALLPGLEEEGNEYFDRVMLIIDKFAKCIGHADFYHSLWLCLICSPSLRRAGIHYLLRRTPNLAARPEDVAQFLGNDSALLVRALSAALDDKDLLVQRGVLEFLVTQFSLKQKLFSEDDKLFLVRAALGVVLRKDMSLNRRLYAWILGGADSQVLDGEIQAVLVAALKTMFSAPGNDATECGRPYKILISLMDRLEIGHPVINELLMDIFWSLKGKLEQHPELEKELLPTANMFFEMVDPYVIWKQFVQMIVQSNGWCFGGSKSSMESEREWKLFGLLGFVLTKLKFSDEEVIKIHFPFLLAVLVNQLQHLHTREDFLRSMRRLPSYLLLLTQLHDLIPPGSWVRVSPTTSGSQARLSMGDIYRRSSTPAVSTGNLISSNTGTTGKSIVSENNEDVVITSNDIEDEYHKTRRLHQLRRDRVRVYETIVRYYVEGGAESLMSTPESPQYRSLFFQNIQLDPFMLLQCITSVYEDLLKGLVLGWFLPYHKDFNQTDDSPLSPLSELANVDAGMEVELLKAFEKTVVVMNRCFNLHREAGLVRYFEAAFIDQSDSSNNNNSTQWVDALVKCCEVNVFKVVDVALTCLLDVAEVWRPTSVLLRNDMECVTGIAENLWHFLSPQYTSYHFRVTELFWRIAERVGHFKVESIFAKYVSTPTVQSKLDAMDKFGAFFRISDELVPQLSAIFSRPVLLIIDLLNSENAQWRRASQTWLRNNVKDYMRLIEPLLIILSSSKIRRERVQITIRGEPMSIFYYRTAFNEAQVGYAFRTLLCLVEFADKVFVKSTARQVNNRAWTWLSDAMNVEKESIPSPLKYSDFLILLSLRFLQSESTTRQANIAPIHSTAAEFLNGFLMRMPLVPIHHIPNIQTVVLRKLLYCIEHKQPDPQVNLLRVLTTLLSSMGSLRLVAAGNAAVVPGGHRRWSQMLMSVAEAGMANMKGKREKESEKDKGKDEGIVGIIRDFVDSPLLKKVLEEAIATASNRAVFNHFIDFFIAGLKLLKNDFLRILLPILKSVSDEVIRTKDSLSKHLKLYSSWRSDETKVRTEFSDIWVEPSYFEQDLFMLMGAIGKIFIVASNDENNFEGYESMTPIATMAAGVGQVMVSGSVSSAVSSSVSNANQQNVASVQGRETGYLRGFMNNMLLGEATTTVGGSMTQLNGEEPPLVKISLLSQLPVVLQIFHDIWIILQDHSRTVSEVEKVALAQRDQPMIHFINNFRGKVKQFAETMYQLYPTDFVMALVEVWFAENPDAHSMQFASKNWILEKGPSTRDVAIDILHSVSLCSPKSVIFTTFEVVRFNTFSASRDKSRRPFIRPTPLSEVAILKFLEKYCATWMNADALSDALPRFVSYCKDVLNFAASFKSLFPSLLRIMTVLLESAVVSSVYEDKKLKRDFEDVYQKLCDHCIWIAGRAFDQSVWKKAAANLDVVSEPISVVQADSAGIVAGVKTSRPEGDLVEEVVQDLSVVVIPSLRRIIMDQERVVGVLVNMVYYVVANGLRNRKGLTSEQYLRILDIICAMARIPFAHRAWRKEAWEAFMDSGFFQMETAACQKWRIIIHSLMANDKDKFLELMNRINAPASLFSSNYEDRALALRKLSFVIFCGSQDQYVSQLPVLQEKIVDTLKTNNSLLLTEVYLILRILFCRVSPNQLSHFWPIILTDLIRLFGLHIREDQPVNDLKVFLAACKFLDIILVYGVEEFQWHQWIFLSESAEKTPIALVDKLWQRISGKSVMEADISQVMANDVSTGLRRPILTMRIISSINQLEPFLKYASARLQQSVYKLEKPDTLLIDNILENEFLDLDIMGAVDLNMASSLPSIVERSTTHDETVTSLASTKAVSTDF